MGIGEGASLDGPKLRRGLDLPGGDVRTSMQKDFDAGGPLELDAIAEPIQRGGRLHGVPTPMTDELVQLVKARLDREIDFRG